MTDAHRQPHNRQGMLIAGFVLANLLAKGAFIGINTGEYTDGILQITALKSNAGLYPPMYEGLSRAIMLSGLSLETAARVVSVLGASLCVIPVYYMGRTLGGVRSAAVFAAILYTLAPMPWRWSVRVMTDSLYLLFSTSAMALLTWTWVEVRSGAISALRGDSAQLSYKVASGYLAMAVLYGGMAALTRYQGAVMAPLFLIVLILLIRRFRRVPWTAVLVAIAAAVSAGAWILKNQFVHAGQFTSRVANTPTATIMAWWNNLESFVLISPYYMGYPIVAGALAGLFLARHTAEPWHLRPTAILWGGYAVLLLMLHAAFGSFQYRYMMPLLPLVCALAGVGFAGLEQWAAAQTNGPRYWVWRGAVLLSLVYLTIFSLAVLTLQRGTYGDQREAAEYIRRNVPVTTPVYSNERYGPHVHLGSVKLSYWSSRPVQVLLTPDQPMPPGSILVLGTAYGGNEAISALMMALNENYTLRPLTQQAFHSEIIPLMDDIMTEPLYNQNPLAWVLRYVPQHFATQLFEVHPKSPAGAANGA